MFDAIIADGLVKKYSHGKFESIVYSSGQWFLANWDDKLNTWVKDDTAFCYAFSLSDVEHDKSISYPTVTTILFDEFLTRGQYLQDEFIIFMNVLSTIIRQRDNVKIFMLGNTVNKYSPYFNELGLTHIQKMKQGTIDVYSYGNSNLHVAVEYCDTSVHNSKPSDVYFAFDNPSLQMIKGGTWEVAIYPHLPYKYKPDDVLYTFFIVFDNHTVQCEVIYKNGEMFMFCHFKTTELQYKPTDVIYQLESVPDVNVRKSFIYPIDRIDRNILKLFKLQKVFYQSNDVGEVVRNYINSVKGGVIL